MTRATWTGDDGADRVGHSGDVVIMLDDLGIECVTACPGDWVVKFRKARREGGEMDFVVRPVYFRLEPPSAMLFHGVKK